MPAPRSDWLARSGCLLVVCFLFGLGLPLRLGAQLPDSAPLLSGSAQPLPSLGDGDEWPLGDERQLGDRIARALYQDPDFVDDPVVGDYVQSIWQPLLAAARARGELDAAMQEQFAWQVLLGRDRSVNAFALPGGYLGLHLGLVAVTGSRDELAAVLAHELTHVTQRHVARRLAQQNAQAPWLLGAMVLGMLAASRSPDAGAALVAGGQAAGAQAQLNFSREMEQEADRIGLAVLAQAGFAPQGFVGMFEQLQHAARLNDSGAFPYLRTHPLTTQRVAEVQARLFGLPAQPGPGLTLEHAMVRARARVLSHGGVDALRAQRSLAQAADLPLQPLVQRAGVVYAAALAASRLQEPAQARALAQRLQGWLAAEAPADTAARRVVELLVLELAEPGMMPGPLLRDGGLPATRAQVLAVAAAEQVQAPQRATARLQAWLDSHAQDALAWQQLAGAWRLQDQPVRALRAEAEAHAARLDLPAALDRLRAAQEWTRQRPGAVHPVDAAIVEARSRQLQAQWQQMQRP